MNNNMNETTMKVCNRCKSELPATKEFYYSDKSKNDGLSTLCKTCKNKSIEKYKQKNLDKYISYQKKYHAKEENKQRKKINDKQYREKHKEEYKKYFKQYYKNNCDEIKKRVRKYREENKELIKMRYKRYYSTFEGKTKIRIGKQKRRAKMKKLPSRFTVKQWRLCLEYFDHKCAYCDCSGELEQEHFISVNNGGWYTVDNIVPSCLPCNRNKRDYDFFEWYPNFKHYSKQREKKILKYLNYKDDKTQQLALL